jgi:hypothetical protein
LLDTGADRTAVSANLLEELGLPQRPNPEQLGGIGGFAPSVLVQTEIHMWQNDGTDVLFRGEFVAFPDPAVLDMSVLGRDITNLLAVIVDRPSDFVSLLGQRHRYQITSG